MNRFQLLLDAQYLLARAIFNQRTIHNQNSVLHKAVVLYVLKKFVQKAIQRMLLIPCSKSHRRTNEIASADKAYI